MFLTNKKGFVAVLKCTTVIVIGIFLAFTDKISVNAAGTVICHEHNENCYAENWVDCRDTVAVSNYNQDFYCSGCQRISTAIVIVETYVCSDGSGYREYKSTGYCCNCPTVVYTKEVPATEVHRRWKKICVCGMSSDTVIAKAEFTKSTEEWTKESVTLNANVTEPIAGVSQAPYTYAFSVGEANGTSCVVNENGNYSVVITAANGQQMTASLQVNNIDKEAPQMVKCYVDKEYPEYVGANIIVEAVDNVSGLAENAYSFDGGKTFVKNSSYGITSNGTYSVMVKDKAGNCSSRTITVTCFAKKAEPAGNVQTSQTVKLPEVEKSSSIGENQEKKESVVNNSKVSQKDKKEAKEENGEENGEAYTMLKTKLEQSIFRVPLNKIPGVYSSLMRSNAEKNAVPMTLNVVSEKAENAYSPKTDVQENLVKNITIGKEKIQSYGTFAQVTKATVATGVLLCIGMLVFLIVFLVKKQ